MIIETDSNTKYNYQIGLDMLYQEGITEYIKRSKYFKKNIRNSYTVIWEFCNKHFQKYIETNIDNEMKIKENLIKLLKSIKILIN